MATEEYGCLQNECMDCYDGWYVAVAEALGMPLATLDTRLSRSTGPTCEFLTPTGS